ncbi:MAG: TolC family protein [Steroidobacteraceae bacterium]
MSSRASRMARNALVSLAVATLTACATYQPEPLAGSDTDAVLAAPDIGALQRDAREIDRPDLQPVSLDLAKPLGSDAIGVIAVLKNPDLAAMRARTGVRAAQVFAAGLLPDPTFSAGVDRVLSGPDTLDGLAGSIGLDLNALRTRHVIRARATADARQVRLDLAWAEWQVSGQARLQAARVVALERQKALLARSSAWSQALLERTLRAAGRGDYSADQAAAARIAAFDSADRARTAAAELATARFELTRLLGLPPDYPLALAPPILTADAPSAERLFARARDSRTDLAALRAGYDAQEAAVRKAVLDQFPNLSLLVNGSRDTANNVLLGPTINLTLPLWNRNRGGIAIERATREALQAEYGARVFQTRAEIAAAVAQLEIARTQRRAIEANLPAVIHRANVSRGAAARGDLALAMAETAAQTLRDQQYLLAKSEQTIAEQTIALELLTGTLRETWNE